MSLPFRIAVVIAGAPRHGAAGRDHALSLACLLAGLGAETHVVTDHRSDEATGPEWMATGRAAPGFGTALPPGPLDWVLAVAPEGSWPEEHASLLARAAAAGARLALLNPAPDSWPAETLASLGAALGQGGALVLSGSRTADAAVRHHHGLSAPWRFEVWTPPIGAAADRAAVPKDGSVLVVLPARPGPEAVTLLSALDPTLLAGRPLRLLSEAVPPRDLMGDLRPEMLGWPPDTERFHAMAAAQVVVFPCTDGIGSLPVEAAFLGSGVLCLDHPVLRERLGDMAHLVPPGDPAAAHAALAAALAAPARQPLPRQAAARFADPAYLLADILLRGMAAVPALIPAGAPPRPRPSMPPLRLISAAYSSAGEVLLSGRGLWPALPDRLEAGSPDGPALPVLWRAEPPEGDAIPVLFHVLAPRGVAGHTVALTASAAGALLGPPQTLRVERLRAAPRQPALCVIKEDLTADRWRLLRGWVLACKPVTSVRFSPDGRTWFDAPASPDSRDVVADHPACPFPRSSFSLEMPAADAVDPAGSRLLCLAGDVAVDLLAGWPLHPDPHFPRPPAFGIATALQ